MTQFAFPILASQHPNQIQSEPGMMLRDYFAAKAMHGQLAAQANHEFGVWSDFDALAKEAYLIADAMLEAREKNK